MAIACPKCNLVYKKKIEKIDVGKWAKKQCSESCNKVCSDYDEMREEYTRRNQMVLQPLGYSKNGTFCSIDYDLFWHIYEPAEKLESLGLDFLVGNHIERFDLNGARFSHVLVEICENIVEFQYMGIRDKNDVLKYIEHQQYENIIGPLFVKFLKKNFACPEKNTDDLYAFCKLLILLDTLV